EISQRATEYFAQRVQLQIEIAGFPGPLAVDDEARSDQPSAGVLARMRAAELIFAGPGSPSYALSTWRGSPVPEALADKLAHGGVVTFSSAAALTIGRFSLPVYEIYKVGQPVHWLDGLDLLSPLGFGPNCVVIPHFDNAEGGTHDTRFCYMCARRLAVLEDLRPDDGGTWGVEEHTALPIDLAAGEASISGRGVVSVGRGVVVGRFPGGTRLPLAELASAPGEAASAGSAVLSESAPPAESE